MCLFIDDEQPLPLRSKKAIIVWKNLEFGFSPYQDVRYFFGRKKTVTKLGIYENRVDEGLHSYRTEEAALEYCCGNRTTHPAIIPKDSLVMFGDDDEVVSTALIVYSDMKELKSDGWRVGKPVPRKKLLRASK